MTTTPCPITGIPHEHTAAWMPNLTVCPVCNGPLPATPARPASDVDRYTAIALGHPDPSPRPAPWSRGGPGGCIVRTGPVDPNDVARAVAALRRQERAQ